MDNPFKGLGLEFLSFVTQEVLGEDDKGFKFFSALSHSWSQLLAARLPWNVIAESYHCA